MNKAELKVCADLLQKPGVRVMRRGWPDFLVNDNGRIYAVEVKAGADFVSAEQQEVHAALESCGIKTEVVRADKTGRLERDEWMASEFLVSADTSIHALVALDRQIAKLVKRREELGHHVRLNFEALAQKHRGTMRIAVENTMRRLAC